MPESSTPLLTAEFANGAIAWRHRLDANLPAFDVRLIGGEAPLRLEAETLQVEIAGAADDLGSGRVVLSGGAVQWPAHRLRLSGIGAEAQLSGGGLEPGRPGSDRGRGHRRMRASRRGSRRSAFRARCSRRAIGSALISSWRTRPAPPR